MAGSDEEGKGFWSRIKARFDKVNEVHARNLSMMPRGETDRFPPREPPRTDHQKPDADNSTPESGDGWLGRVKGGLENHFKKMDDLTPGLYDEPPPPKIDDEKSNADESTHKAKDAWYYAAQGQKHGPIEFEKLKSLLASGVIGRDTIVWRHGMSDWIPLDQTEIWASVPEAYSPPPRHCQRDRTKDQVKNLLTKKI
jgi:hypothetical protein